MIAMNGGPGRGNDAGTGRGDPSSTPASPNLAELSEKDMMNVLAIIRQEFNIDEKRTYLMGYSMGGAGAFFLGPKYVDQWAAVASMAPAACRMSPESLAPVKDKMPLGQGRGGSQDERLQVSTTAGRRSRNRNHAEYAEIFKFFSERTR